MIGHPAAPAPRRLSWQPGAQAAAAERALRGPRRVDATADLWTQVTRRAEAEPNRVAVAAAAGSVTYGQLVVRAGQIRALLLEHRCGAGDRVSVAGPRCADTIAAFLAVASIGAIYVPVDTTWPAARTAAMFRRVRPIVCLLTTGGAAASPDLVIAAGDAGIPLAERPSAQAPVAAVPPRQARPDEARYIIHTSGSTGRPKGALVQQRGLMNNLWSMVERLGLTASDAVAFTAPPHFVVSMWQMLAALLVGGRVAVFDDEDLHFGRRIIGRAQQLEVTVLELVPTVIGWVVHEARRRTAVALPALRWLVSTGELLRPMLAGSVLATLPHVSLLNAYGQSECSDDVALHQVTAIEPAAPAVAIGAPIGNAVLYLLVEEDGRWRAAEPGEVGELWIGGLPVGGGYLDEPALTGAVFVEDDIDPGSPTGRLYRTRDLARFDNGLAYCLGRTDRQIKVAGVRIELDEIETTLAACAAVFACAVVARPSGDQQEIVAYYVAEPVTRPEDLHRHMRTRLPPAMVPRHWVRLDALPVTSRGKVDYQALVIAPA